MSELTEREKWLMNQAWMSGRHRTDCDNMQEWLDIEDYGSLLQSLLNEAPKAESIVKTVDSDNLPDGEVLVARNNETMKCSLTRRGKRALSRDGFFIHKESGFTHYIEQEDLIKLIESK